MQKRIISKEPESPISVTATAVERQEIIKALNRLNTDISLSKAFRCGLNMFFAHHGSGFRLNLQDGRSRRTIPEILQDAK